MWSISPVSAGHPDRETAETTTAHRFAGWKGRVAVRYRPTRECGKSTIIDLLAKLAWGAITAANVSTASLFRLIERDQCTAMLDDIDSWITGEDRQDIASILNAGFKRGARVVRVEPTADGGLEPKLFAVFGPKVLGGIGRKTLADTTASRTIRVDMQKQPSLSLRALKRPRDAELEAQCGPLRAQARRWMLEHVDELKARRPSMPDSLVGRAADMADTLLAIAELAGSEWATRICATLTRALGRPDDRSDTKAQLLADLATLFTTRSAKWLASEDIVTWLKSLEERPWAEWGKKGQGLTTKALADLLSDFEIRSTKGSDNADRKGHLAKAFEPAWAAYSIEKVPGRPLQSSGTSESLRDNELHQNQPSGRPEGLRKKLSRCSTTTFGGSGASNTPG